MTSPRARWGRCDGGEPRVLIPPRPRLHVPRACDALLVTQLGGWAGDLVVERAKGSELTLTGLSTFGNLTSGGELAAVIDGETSESTTTSANATTANGWAGVTLSSPARFFEAYAYGSNNGGFVNAANPTVSLYIWAKTGSAPATYNDGTVIGSTSFTDTTNESAGRLITMTDNETEWDHVWIEVSPGSSAAVRLAELRLWLSV